MEIILLLCIVLSIMTISHMWKQLDVNFILKLIIAAAIFFSLFGFIIYWIVFFLKSKDKEKVLGQLNSKLTYCFFLCVPVLNLALKLVLEESEWPILSILLIVLCLMWFVAFALLKNWKAAGFILIPLICYFGVGRASTQEFIANSSYVVNLIIVAILSCTLLPGYSKLNKPFRILLLGVLGWLVLFSIYKMICPVFAGVDYDYTLQSLLFRCGALLIVSLPPLFALSAVNRMFGTIAPFAPLVYAVFALFLWELIPLPYTYNILTNIVAVLVYWSIAKWVTPVLKSWFYVPAAKEDLSSLLLTDRGDVVSRSVFMPFLAIGTIFVVVIVVLISIGL